MSVGVHIQFDHRTGNLTYEDLRLDRTPCVGETVHIMDANRPEYIRSAFWTVAEVTWHANGRKSGATIRVVPGHE